MEALDIHTTPLAGLAVVRRRQREDSRGSFSRFYCADTLARAGFPFAIAQMNHTRTALRGTVRGMHFQHPPQAEDKLVSCLRGEVFDVAVDLRRGSPTFLRWHAQIISAVNLTSLLIPKGFAHGFQTLADDCEMLYLHSTPYASTAEGALHANDPRLRIEWPLPVAALSPRDAEHPFIAPDFDGI